MKTSTTSVALAGALLLLLSASAQSAISNPSQSDVETTAKTHMTAFFRGDIRTASNYMHPDTLSALRAALLRDLDNAIAAGKEGELLAQMNLKQNAQTLRSLSPKEPYVVLVESDHRKNEKAFRAMEGTIVTVVNSTFLQSGEAIVRLTITTPTPSGTKTQDGSLLLAKADGEWKVKGNSQ